MTSEVQEWTHAPREGLDHGDVKAGPGPWWNEPDKRHWVDQATDLDCLMVRNRSGQWCGYVAVTEEHPLFGQDYEAADVEVHGGLTFADFCDENAPEGHGICHMPLPGRPDKVWWFGFDTGHAWDISPILAVTCPELYRTYSGEAWPANSYKDVTYVQAECESLAKQLRALA